MEQKILHFVSVKTVMAKAAPVTVFAEMQKLVPAKPDPTVFTPNRCRSFKMKRNETWESIDSD